MKKVEKSSIYGVFRHNSSHILIVHKRSIFQTARLFDAAIPKRCPAGKIYAAVIKEKLYGTKPTYPKNFVKLKNGR